MPRKKAASPAAIEPTAVDPPPTEPEYRLPEGHTLVLRSCRADHSSHSGFVWPASGPVEAPDWRPTASCGNGLHGLTLGQNNPGIWYDHGLSLIVDVLETDLIPLEGGVKCKFPRGTVVYSGDQAGASAFFAKHCPGGAEGLYRRVDSGGDRSTLTGGNDSTLVARWFDGQRWRIRVHYVGEDGILAETKYRTEKGQLVLIDAQPALPEAPNV